jgi:AcrR family transcriptional regulator
MPRPKQISDEEILAVARECFLESGVAVSAQVIADRVGLSQPALFKRFGTKDELVLRALAPPERLPVLDWIETVPVPGPFRPQLAELLEKIWDTLRWILPRIALLTTSHFSPETIFARYQIPPPLRVIMAVADALERARDNGQIRADIRPEMLSQMIFGVLQSRAFFRFMLRSDNSADDALYIEATVDLLYRGIAPTEKE